MKLLILVSYTFDYFLFSLVFKIILLATARLAARPQNYDVIVTLNLYGDIMSDVAAEVAGSVGLAGSANIGQVKIKNWFFSH